MEEKSLRWMMGSQEGRKVMLDILELTGVYRTDTNDWENTNMVLVGRRSVGSDLLREIRSLEREAGEDGLSLEYRMLREEQERQRRALDDEEYEED